MVVKYETRKPVDPFKKQIPWKWVILGVVLLLVLFFTIRGCQKEEAVEEPVVVEEEPVVEPEPVSEPEPPKPLTIEERLQPPNFDDVDVELGVVI